MTSRPTNVPEVETKVDQTFHPVDSNVIERWEAMQSEAYREYRRRWRENPVNRVVEGFPVHLDVEATSYCNLKCTMCPRTDLVEHGQFWRLQHFDFDTYCRLIDEGVANGLCSVKFNYLGEPLMNPRLLDMIRYAKSKGVLDVMFNTNATLLDRETSEALIDSGLDQLFFSFDGASKEQYEMIRVGANYEKVINNIRTFYEVRQARGVQRPFTRVSMVLMKETKDCVDEFVRLFEGIVDAVALLDYTDHSSQHPDRGMVDLTKVKAKFCCPQLWQRMFVHPDGVVTPCCIDSARELKVGNIFKQSAQEIWLGKSYQRMRELHATGRFDEIPTCTRCPLAHY